MRRCLITPRPGWEEIVQSQGLTWHLTDGRPYWNESAYYRFSADEIARLETATDTLNTMCLQAVEHVIQNNEWASFGIAPQFHDWIRRSWETDEVSILGRFDFAFDGGAPKLLEFNADTPTALLEAAVVQWFWFEQFSVGKSEFDQWNSIHDRLIEAWKRLKGPIVFTSINDGGEDFTTVSYLRDTAIQAGLETAYIDINDIGWNNRRGFTDRDENTIEQIWKLYPWEWLAREKFGRHLPTAATRWLEPPWKMLLSNKALLPVLWKLFPESPYLLPASFEPLAGNYVRKPILGREGANVSVVAGGVTIAQTGGPYDGPCIYQEYVPLPYFDEGFPIIGSWLVNGWACGIGVREDVSRITSNKCRFVPHVFDK